MSIERSIGRYSSKTTNPSAQHNYTGWIEPTAAGETITWGDWSKAPTADKTMAITLFPYACFGDHDNSGTVERSNYRALVDDEHVMRRSVLVEGGYGTTGIAYIGFPTRRIRAICDSLYGYPLLDEDAHSEMEMEMETEQWADHGRHDFKRAIEEAFDLDLDDRETHGTPEDLDGLLDRLWWSYSEGGSGDTHWFEGDACCFRHDGAIEWMRKTLYWDTSDGDAWLVLCRVEYNERHTFSVARDAALEGRLDDARKILAAWPDAVIIEFTSDDASGDAPAQASV